MSLIRGFPGGSAVKKLPANAGDVGLDPRVGKITWRRKWQPTPVLLPGKSHGQRSLAGYSPWVAKSWTQLSVSHMSMSEQVPILLSGLYYPIRLMLSERPIVPF